MFHWDWNDFFSNYWSKYNFRKEFLLPHYPKPHPNNKSSLILTLEYEQTEKDKVKTEDNPAESNKPQKKILTKIEITQEDFTSENDHRTKNILKTPLVFGRGTKAYQPDICIPVEYISNKHFQIAAYSRGLPTDGFYITDLLSKAKTGLKIDSFCYIDDGNVLEFNSFQMSICQVRPRYLEDDPELENGLYVKTRIERAHAKSLEKPFIELCELDTDDPDKKRFENDVYLSMKRTEKGEIIDLKWTESPVVGNIGKDNLKFEEVAKFSFNKTNKWICESTVGKILLVNREECEGKKLSTGLKLKVGNIISCGEVKLTVNSLTNKEEEKKENDKKK